MRRILMILSLLLVSGLVSACGDKNTAVPNANAQANSTGAGTTGAGAPEGTGPKTQGIGGNTSEGVVNGNTYTVPPGFNKNGDRGSASNVSNTP